MELIEAEIAAGKGVFYDCSFFFAFRGLDYACGCGDFILFLLLIVFVLAPGAGILAGVDWYFAEEVQSRRCITPLLTRERPKLSFVKRSLTTLIRRAIKLSAIKSINTERVWKRLDPNFSSFFDTNSRPIVLRFIFA